MTTRSVLVCFLLTAACEGNQGDASIDPDSVVSEEPAMTANPTELPPMPEYPSARRGHLVVVTAGGTDTIQGNWPASAQVCQEPPALLVRAESPDVGFVVLLHRTAEDTIPRVYRVAATDSGFPIPPAAQVGVQQVTERGVSGFRGVFGTVELEALEPRAAGRIAVTLRELESSESRQFAAVFAELPVQPARPEDCETLRGGAPNEEPDSSASPIGGQSLE